MGDKIKFRIKNKFRKILQNIDLKIIYSIKLNKKFKKINYKLKLMFNNWNYHKLCTSFVEKKNV